MGGRRRGYQEGGAGIAVITVQLGRHVDIHDIPGGQGSGPGNTVGRFFVQADAGGAGEAVIALGGGARPVLRQ